MICEKIAWVDGECKWATGFSPIPNGLRRVHQDITEGWYVIVEEDFPDDMIWHDALMGIGKVVEETDHFSGLSFFVNNAVGLDYIVVLGDVDPMLFKLLTDIDLVYSTTL